MRDVLLFYRGCFEGGVFAYDSDNGLCKPDPIRLDRIYLLHLWLPVASELRAHPNELLKGRQHPHTAHSKQEEQAGQTPQSSLWRTAQDERLFEEQKRLLSTSLQP